MTPYVRLIAVSFGLLVIDYTVVYPTLADMTRQLQQARPANFQSYHHASMYINSALFATSLVASVLANIVCSRAEVSA